MRLTCVLGSIVAVSIYAATHSTAYGQGSMFAVVPFAVGAEPNPNLRNAHARWASWRRTEAYEFQSHLHSALTKQRTTRDRQLVRYQDLEITNTLLMQAGIDEQSIGNYSAEQVASSLGVDGIVSGSIDTWSMPQARVNAMRGFTVFGSLLNATLGGSAAPPKIGDQELAITVSIHDGSAGELLWVHERKVEYWDRAAPDRQIEMLRRVLMSQAARKARYTVAP